jgi:hypothetical protein
MPSLRHQRHRAGVIVRAAALAALAAAVGTPAIPVTAASAQVGSLLRKTKDKAAAEAARRSGATAALEGEPVAFDDVIVELTDERISSYLAGVRAGDAVEQQNAGTLATLQARRVALANQSADLATRHGSEIDAQNDRVRTVERCRDAEMESRTRAHREQLSQRMMSDASLRQKVIAMMQKQGEAVSRGDTAGARKVENELRAMAGEGRADTAAVDQTCGVVPARHPAAAQIAALDAEVASIDAQLRGGEEKAAAAEAAASGFNARQFAMVRERVTMFLARAKGGSPQRGFTPVELRALEARRAELERVG